jgi:hypothetical protein
MDTNPEGSVLELLYVDPNALIDTRPWYRDC